MDHTLNLDPKVEALVWELQARGAVAQPQTSKSFFVLRSDRSDRVVASVRAHHHTPVMSPEHAQHAIAQGGELERQTGTSWYVRYTNTVLSDPEAWSQAVVAVMMALIWAQRDPGRPDRDGAPRRPEPRPQTPRDEQAEAAAIAEQHNRAALRLQADLETRYGQGWAARELDVDDYFEAIKMDAKFLHGPAALHEYWHRRRTTLQELLGIGLDPDGQADRTWRQISQFFEDCVELLNRTIDPFDGYLEAPRAIYDLNTRHGQKFHELSEERNKIVLEVLTDCIERYYPTAAAAHTSWGDLHARGVDPKPPHHDDDPDAF